MRWNKKVFKKYWPILVGLAVVVGLITSTRGLWQDYVKPSCIYLSSWVKRKPSSDRQLELLMVDIERYKSKVENLRTKREELYKKSGTLREEIFKIEDKKIFYEKK